MHVENKENFLKKAMILELHHEINTHNNKQSSDSCAI